MTAPGQSGTHVLFRPGESADPAGSRFGRLALGGALTWLRPLRRHRKPASGFPPSPGRLLAALAFGALAALCVAAVAGCGPATMRAFGLTSPATAAQPVIAGEDGGSATLTLIACPPQSIRGAEELHDVLAMLVSYSGLIVSAHQGGSGRLTIDVCPFLPLDAPPGGGVGFAARPPR